MNLTDYETELNEYKGNNNNFLMSEFIGNKYNDEFEAYCVKEFFESLENK